MFNAEIQQRSTKEDESVLFVYLLISLCLKSMELDSAFVIVSQNQRILILMAGAQTCSIALEHLLPGPTQKSPPPKKKYIYLLIQKMVKECSKYSTMLLSSTLLEILTDDAIA